jgi:phospholipid transport system substrate-binding protein
LRKKGCLFVGLWMLTSAVVSWAGEPTTVVQDILNQAMDIQSRPELQGAEHREERFQAIKKLIAEYFLTVEMAQDSLDRYWDELTPEQRSEFEEIFSDLFQNSYTTMVLNFLKKETIECKEEKPADHAVEVRTLILRANEHIPVDYFLVQKKGRWLIQDVEIDGVSIVGNYRNAFHRVIVNESFHSLLKKMRIQRQAVIE